jgi:glutamate synthase (NADPH/NADH) small chain
MGHAVTVFEKAKKIGGILRYGIPDFKLEKHIIDRRLAQMEAEGVRFVTDVTIGEDISARYLQRQFDVILLCMGAGQPRDLQVPGRGLEGVHYAMPYLHQSNKRVSGESFTEKEISARGKNVLVIGGGDTGSDCIGTAIRQGAKKVYQFEILSKPDEWSNPWNPSWPNWPRILRSSSSHEEGCERQWCVVTKQFSGRDVAVEEGHFAKVKYEDLPDGKAPRMTEEAGSGFSLKLDLVILAMGFVHVEHSRLLEDLGVTLDDRGNISAGRDYITSSQGIFVAGDAGTGASLVVRAIYHGRGAAEAIHKYLEGKLAQ